MERKEAVIQNANKDDEDEHDEKDLISFKSIYNSNLFDFCGSCNIDADAAVALQEESSFLTVSNSCCNSSIWCCNACNPLAVASHNSRDRPDHRWERVIAGTSALKVVCSRRKSITFISKKGFVEVE